MDDRRDDAEADAELSTEGVLVTAEVSDEEEASAIAEEKGADVVGASTSVGVAIVSEGIGESWQENSPNVGVSMCEVVMLGVESW